MAIDAGTVARDGTLPLEPDPLFPAAAALVALDRDDPAPADLLVLSWSTSEVRVPANRDGWVRYRWLTSTLLPIRYPSVVPDKASWAAWRPAEEPARRRELRRFESRLIEPIILSDSLELLGRVADGGGDMAAAAATLLAEAMPSARRDLARFLGETHAWSDTWALWNVSRRPAALRRLHPFALALADTYAERAIAAGSTGTGSRFPFHDQPMASVSAQLASGLLALGFHPRLTGRLVSVVRDAEDAAGGWGDAGGPVDPLTTLVAADLLIGLDPGWDPSSTVAALGRLRGANGGWTAYGPESGWLTIEIDRFLARADEPFERRFRWPELAAQQRDRRTQLPFLGYLMDLERLFVEIDSLRDAPVELAFLDLAGFGAWNNVFGMAAGDEVLRFLAEELQAIPDSVAIRDGGDEFVIVGGPCGTGLSSRLTDFRHTFAARFQVRFGPDALPVAPRVVTMTAAGRGLVAGRDRLGRDIATLKGRAPTPPRDGIQAASAELAS